MPYDTDNQAYVLVGGFPTDLDRHAATREINAYLDETPYENTVVALEDGEISYPDVSGEQLYEDVLDPMFRETDFSTQLNRIADAAEQGTVHAIGYCTGGTLLAAYQQQAHETGMTPFASVVVLDAPSGITTDAQDITVPAYTNSDMIGIADTQLSDSTIDGVPQLVVDDTQHLWDDVPDNFGALAATAAAVAADTPVSRQKQELQRIAAEYDAVTYQPPDDST